MARWLGGKTQRVVLGALVLGGGLALLGVVFIDDWTRDFTTNVATTSADAADPLLHPIETALPVPDVVAIVKQVGEALPRWEFTGERSEDGAVELNFVRTTRVFRFKDDITVSVSDQRGRRIVSATSRSRLGKADLGQNPRNLKELFRALRDRVR